MHVIIADTPKPLSKRQRVFFQYFTFVLIDLTVLSLILLVVSINLFADWLREELNPKIER